MHAELASTTACAFRSDSAFSTLCRSSILKALLSTCKHPALTPSLRFRMPACQSDACCRLSWMSAFVLHHNHILNLSRHWSVRQLLFHLHIQVSLLMPRCVMYAGHLIRDIPSVMAEQNTRAALCSSSKLAAIRALPKSLMTTLSMSAQDLLYCKLSLKTRHHEKLDQAVCCIIKPTKAGRADGPFMHHCNMRQPRS